MSVQVGVPTKCPACAKAVPPKVVSRLNAATVAMRSRAIERFMRVVPPPNGVILRRAGAVPAHQEEPMIGVEREREVRAHSAQGIAWPPPRRSGGLRCRPLARTRRILCRRRGVGGERGG